jgi:hypothetical protein
MVHFHHHYFYVSRNDGMMLLSLRKKYYYYYSLVPRLPLHLVKGGRGNLPILLSN